MSGVHIEYRIGRELADEMARLTAVQTNTLLRSVQNYMDGEIRDRFAEGKLWDDSPMPMSKAAQAQGRQTLVDTGHLRDSYHVEVEGDAVVMGSDSQLALIHDQGAKAHTIYAKGGALKFSVPATGPRGGAKNAHVFVKRVDIPELPARPVVGVNPRNDREIAEELLDLIGRMA